MTRNRILTVLVFAGFALLAVTPIFGVRPIDFAKELVTASEESSIYDSALTEDEHSEPMGKVGSEPVGESKRIEIGSFNNQDPEVAKAAVYALSNSLDGDEISVLFPIVMEADHAEVRKAALYAIGNHESPLVHEFLKEVALSNNDVELSKAAVYALANTDSDEAVSILTQVAHSGTATDVKKAAVHALGNIDSPEAREALIAIVEQQ